MNATTEFIYFDMGNVLLNFDHDRGCRQIADVSGVSPEQVREIIIDSQLQRDYETGQINSEQFVESFRQQTRSNPSTSQFLLAASDMFWLNRKMVPLVTQLKSIAFPMGLLSNTCHAHWNFASSPRFIVIQDYFTNNCILSFESKSMKPDGKIYRDAIQRAAVPPEKIFFVDDRPENVQAAIQAGLDAHVFKCDQQVYNLLYQRGVKLNL